MFTTREELREWAEDHGYRQYRNPHTGRLFWSDGDPAAECGDIDDESGMDEGEE
jgi:hypothetical protein